MFDGWALPFPRTGSTPQRAHRPPYGTAWEASRLNAVNVTLLYFDDCPSRQTADQHLSALAKEMDFTIERVEVTNPEEAEQLRFRGSPSIHIDGVDLFADPDAPVGLSCRIYQTPQGSAGSPTADQLRSALGARR